LAELPTLRGRLQPRNDTAHAQHWDFCDRVRDLGLYLQGALQLARIDLYAPSLANLRTAFEHLQVDHLIFLGRRVVQTVEGVDDATWSEWQRQRRAGEAFATVVDWKRFGKKNVVELIHEGLRSSRPDDDSMISVYYFLLSEYQPFLGKPSAQAQFDDGLTELEIARKFAEQNEAMYLNYLSWKSIKRSLELNGFGDGRTLEMLDVHYNFLSTFVHPLTKVNERLYPRNTAHIPVYDHYTSELILLYAIAFSVVELRHFNAMAQEKPEVDVAGWQATADLCNRAWEQVSYLWFPGHGPHELDRVEEANRQRYRWIRNREGPEPPRPDQLQDDEIGYYRDPIGRLARMHSGFNELMGYSLAALWPRPDALHRW
jgi:hypothetical protein